MLKAKNSKIILIYLLAGVTLFSVFKYASSLKEKYDLQGQLKQARIQAENLEKEKQKLLQAIEKEKEWQKKLEEESTGLKGSLRASENKVAKLEVDVANNLKAVENLNSQVAALQVEKEQLKTELSEVTKQRDNLSSRLNSVTELKKAIKELKSQVHKVGNQIKVKIRKEQVSDGNRGFVIKDGKPTYPSRVRIEVNPASTK